ncbi:MAG: preprotein translocase subunit YajC [Polyangiales bacterium]
MYAILALLMQPEATSPVGTATSTGGGGAGPVGCAGGGGFESMGLMLLMFAVFYFIAIRPQQKQQKQTEQMLSALKKGDIVRTRGGIRGEITQLSDRDVTIQVAERTRINVLRSAVAGLETEEEGKS